MAVAYDTSSLKAFTAGTPVTNSHTCTGSNLVLIVFVWDNAGTTHGTTGVTYNGVAMTNINTILCDTAAVASTSAWYLVNPSTGANNISVATTTAGSTSFVAISYTGAGTPNANNTKLDTTSNTSFSLSVTTVSDNSWVAMGMVDESNAPTAGASTTLRQNSGSGFGGFDSNGAITPAGSTTLNSSFTSSPRETGIIVAIPPYTAPATTKAVFLLNFM